MKNNNKILNLAELLLIRLSLKQNSYSTTNISMYSNLIKNDNILKFKSKLNNKNMFSLNNETEYILFDLGYSSITNLLYMLEKDKTYIVFPVFMNKSYNINNDPSIILSQKFLISYKSFFCFIICFVFIASYNLYVYA